MGRPKVRHPGRAGRLQRGRGTPALDAYPGPSRKQSGDIRQVCPEVHSPARRAGAHRLHRRPRPRRARGPARVPPPRLRAKSLTSRSSGKRPRTRARSCSRWPALGSCASSRATPRVANMRKAGRMSGRAITAAMRRSWGTGKGSCTRFWTTISRSTGARRSAGPSSQATRYSFNLSAEGSP